MLGCLLFTANIFHFSLIFSVIFLSLSRHSQAEKLLWTARYQKPSDALKRGVAASGLTQVLAGGVVAYAYSHGTSEGGFFYRANFSIFPLVPFKLASKVIRDLLVAICNTFFLPYGILRSWRVLHLSCANIIRLVMRGVRVKRITFFPCCAASEYPSKRR